MDHTNISERAFDSALIGSGAAVSTSNWLSPLNGFLNSLETHVITFLTIALLSLRLYLYFMDIHKNKKSTNDKDKED